MFSEAIQGDASNKQLKEVDKHLTNTSSSSIKLETKRDFLTVLLQERGAIAGTVQERAKELMRINSARLSLVRECAVKDFQKWHAHWVEGQRLLEKCDLSFEEIAATIELPDQDGIRNLPVIFPPGNLKLSLSRLLKYIQEHPKYQGQLIRLDTNDCHSAYQRRD